MSDISGGAEGLSPTPCSDSNAEFNDLDSVVYNDIQATWRPGMMDDNLDLTLGVKNLFDEDLPPCYSCALNGFDGNVYDISGQFYYARLRTCRAYPSSCRWSLFINLQWNLFCRILSIRKAS